MKFAVKIVLFIFLSFIAMPTVVCVIKKSSNTSYFYNMSEEELAHKEVKAEYKFDTTMNFAFFPEHTSSLILSENLSKHNNVSASIFIPPPEQV